MEDICPRGNNSTDNTMDQTDSIHQAGTDLADVGEPAQPLPPHEPSADIISPEGSSEVENVDSITDHHHHKDIVDGDSTPSTEKTIAPPTAATTTDAASFVASSNCEVAATAIDILEPGATEDKIATCGNRDAHEIDISSCSGTSDSSMSSSSISSDTSSSSDESEDEVQRVKSTANKRNAGSSDDELIATCVDVDLSKLSVGESLEIKKNIDNIVTKPLGFVRSIINELVIVEPNINIPPLDIESVLFIREKTVLGEVFETFGPVKAPLYSVRFNTVQDIADLNLVIEEQVYYAPEENKPCTQYVFVNNLLQSKGSDASWQNNEEPPTKFLDFSDDETERNNKSKNKKKNKISKPETTVKPAFKTSNETFNHYRSQQAVNHVLPSNNQTRFPNNAMFPVGSSFNAPILPFPAVYNPMSQMLGNAFPPRMPQPMVGSIDPYSCNVGVGNQTNLANMQFQQNPLNPNHLLHQQNPLNPNHLQHQQNHLNNLQFQQNQANLHCPPQFQHNPHFQ